MLQWSELSIRMLMNFSIQGQKSLPLNSLQAI